MTCYTNSYKHSIMLWRRQPVMQLQTAELFSKWMFFFLMDKKGGKKNLNYNGFLYAVKKKLDVISKVNTRGFCLGFGGVPANRELEMYPFRIFLTDNELTGYFYKGCRQATCLLQCWHTCTPSMQPFEARCGSKKIIWGLMWFTVTSSWVCSVSALVEKNGTGFGWDWLFGSSPASIFFK